MGGCACTCQKDEAKDNDITTSTSEKYGEVGVSVQALYHESVAGAKSEDLLKSPTSEAELSPSSPLARLPDLSSSNNLPSSEGPNTSPSARTVGTNHESSQSSRPDTSPSSQDMAGMMSPSSMANNPSYLNVGQLPEDVMSVLEKADQDRQSGYTFVAEKSVLDLMKQLTADGRLDVLAKVKETKQYADLIEALEEVNSLLLSLLDDEGWTLQKEADRIHVWTKPEPGTDLVTVRIAGLVEGPFDNFCSIGKEVHLIKTWMPGVKTSHLIQQLNIFDHIGYYVWKFPLVSAREFLVEEANMINDVEGYCLTRRQPPVERQGVELPAPVKGNIRASISNWCAFSAPCGKNNIFCVTVMNVDLKIPLPLRLVNYLSISMGFQSFKDLRQNVAKASNAKSEFGQCVADPKNSTFYGRMRSLEKTRETKEIPCKQEIISTGWVQDPEDRKKIFNRVEGSVLVPIR